MELVLGLTLYGSQRVSLGNASNAMACCSWRRWLSDHDDKYF